VLFKGVPSSGAWKDVGEDTERSFPPVCVKHHINPHIHNNNNNNYDEKQNKIKILLKKQNF
jgi:hypothetical protein